MSNCKQISAVFVVCLVALATVPCPAIAAGDVRVRKTIEFAADVRTPQKVQDKCKIQTEVPRYIEEYSDQVQLVDALDGTAGRVLDLTIVDARAACCGFYSGGKWVTVDGVLTEDGREIGSFKAKRFTIGYFNMTACGAAHRCSKAVGKDIAKWLENPQMDSKLGSIH